MPCPLHACADKYLAMPKAAAIILAASLFSLGFVFIMQYGFNYQPCILCLWQRVPYGLAIIFSLLCLIPGLRRHAPILLGLCALTFLIGAGLAVFHTGVERHWWLGTSGCAIAPLDGNSVEDLREQLLHMAVARCDQISWTFLGLSMTNYNIVWSLVLAAFSLCAARKAAA